MRHQLHLTGSLEAFTDGIEDSLFLDLAHTEVFLYAWESGERGAGTRAEFGVTRHERCTASKPEEPGRVRVEGGGAFDLILELDSGGASELLKLQGAMRLTDSESGSRRTVTVATGGAPLDLLLKGQPVTCEIRDPFSGNYMKISLQASGPCPEIPIRPTALRHMATYNAAVQQVSKSVQAGIASNQIRIPPGGDMFLSGLTSFEFGGCVTGDGTKVEPLTTHYAIMGDQEKHWNRAVPVALVLYSLYLRLNHSGLTMDQILKGPLLQRAVLFLSGVGLTFDAATIPYVRDFTTGICLSMIQGLGIAEKTTENMALPCGAPQFLGRHIKTPAPIHAPDGLSLDEYVRLLQGRPENNPSVLSDDCESSAGFAVLGLTSLAQGLKRNPDLQALCAGFEPLFAAWGPEDWKAMGVFVHEMVALVESGQLSLSTVTGIATNAAASDGDAPGPQSFNGHCHNVGRLSLPGQPVHCFIVEGTAPMALCRVTPDSPRVTCKTVFADPTQTVTERLAMPDFLTRLGKTVSVMTQIVNRPYGAQTGNPGWPLPEPMTGWVSSTIFSNTLDSDPSFPLKFYNRVMYTSWQCTRDGNGCLPVQEASACKTAGCHPYDLNKVDLRAMSVVLDADTHAKMCAILDEANPPIADTAIFQQLARNWTPAQPVRAMNQAGQKSLAQGVEYLTVSCMETPSSQDYNPVILRIKEPFVREWDRLNRADPRSDGIRLSIEGVGTGITIKLRVPQRDIGELTVIRNGVRAMQALGWKGQIPSLGG